jgi:SPP1 gp7 family putative phage head morphogenesis protein
MNSRDYWLKREEEALKHRIAEEAEYNRQINRIYQDMLDACQKEIDSFYAKYASKEGITIAEAKKRVNKLDIAQYERKARRYVRDKDFSAKANEEMRLYNATMKINRLEMLKANIGLELISGHDELEKFMEKILKGRTEDELKRQAGILGKTVRNNAQKAHAIVNGSFHSGTFSDRIWQYQDLMREDLGRMLQTGLIQGKNPRALAKDLQKYWFGNDPLTGGGARYCMERLMRTELARVQTEAQKQSFIRNGYDQYTFIVNGGCCPICEGLNGKHFDVAKMMPGTNAPPMHPNCRCSTAAYMDTKELDAWLDSLDKGGSSSVSQKKKPIDKGIFSTFNITNADYVRPKSIMNEMNKSELGRSLMEYLEKENVPVHLCYGVDNPNGNCGSYDPFDDVITIFCDVTKTAKDTASTLVHEATHRKLGSKGTFDEEAECFKAELIHKKGTLTKSDIEAIMDHVKKYYPELE